MTDWKKKNNRKKSDIIDDGGYIIPQNKELEQAVLGAIMLEAYLIDKVMSNFSGKLFYSPPNRLVAEVIIELYKKQSPIDILTVAQCAKEMQTLEEIGGPYYIAQLTNRVASSENIETHIRILQQESLRRSLIQVCSLGLQKSWAEGHDVFDLYQELTVDIDNALKEVITYEVQSIGSVHSQALTRARKILASGEKSGVPTELRMVDNVTNGWQRSDLIIFAGRPGMGKTAGAVAMIMNPAIHRNIPTAFFSLEMSSLQVVGRMQASIGEVNVSRIIKNQLSEAEIIHLENKCACLGKAPMYIDDTAAISLLELKGKARKLVREKGVQLIVIDYLQLMTSGSNYDVREQEIGAISRGLKALAKELDIPIIALSQLNRGAENRVDKKPQLSDLRESGQIEQDADMVMFCYRPEYYGSETYEIEGRTFDAKGLYMLIIAKHRNGELGEIPLSFIGELTKVTTHADFVLNKNQSISIGNSEKSSTFVQQDVLSEQGPSITENVDFLNQRETPDELW